MSFEKLVDAELAEIRAKLLEKNRKYGNSALEPARVFSKAGPIEQLLVRIDDKISRIQSGQADDNEDAVRDLIGYLVLLRIARRPSVTAQSPTVTGIGCAGGSLSGTYPEPQRIASKLIDEPPVKLAGGSLSGIAYPVNDSAASKLVEPPVKLADSSKPFSFGNMLLNTEWVERTFGPSMVVAGSQTISILPNNWSIDRKITVNNYTSNSVSVVNPKSGGCLASTCEEVQLALERIAKETA